MVVRDGSKTEHCRYIIQADTQFCCYVNTIHTITELLLKQFNYLGISPRGTFMFSIFLRILTFFQREPSYKYSQVSMNGQGGGRVLTIKLAEIEVKTLDHAMIYMIQ